MSFTESQYDDIAKSLRESAGSLGKIAQKLNGKHPATGSPHDKKEKSKYEKEFERSKRKHHTERNVEHMSRSLKALSGDVEAVSHSFDLFLKVLPAGAAIGGLIGFSKNLVNTWREMAKEGQTFNGSMFKMAAAAGDAGLPLDKFAEIVKKNSKVMATFGQADVSKVMKNVRDLALESGNYGMTIQDLSQVTGDYLEIQRLSGNKQAAMSKTTAKSANEFAATLASLSVATGKNRDEIEQITMQAMSDVAVTTKDFAGNAQAQHNFTDNTMKAVATMASINGEGGKILSDMLSQAAGYGTSLFSEGAKTFIDAGMGDMVSAMDKVGAAMDGSADQGAQASADFLKKFKQEAKDNLSSLRVRAMAGDQAAKQVLDMYAQISSMTDEQIERMQKNKIFVDNFTKFMTVLGGKLQEIFGHVWATLMNHLGNIDKNMDDFLDSKTFKNLEQVFDDLAIKLADWFKSQDVKTWADNIGAAVKTFIDVMTAAGHVLKFLVGTMQKLGKGFDFLVGKGKGSFYAVVTAAVLAMFAPGLIIEGLKGLFAKIAPRFAEFFGIMRGQNTRRMNVVAGAVYVNGEGVGGGGSGGGGGLGAAEEGEHFAKSAGKGSRLGRLGRNIRAARLRAGRSLGRTGIGRLFGRGAKAFRSADKGRFGLIAGGLLGTAAMGSMLMGNKENTAADPSTGDDGSHGGSMMDRLAGAGMGLTTLASFMPKMAGGLTRGVGGKLGMKLGGMAGMKLGARLGGAFIPGLGAALDAYSSAQAFKHHQNLAGGLYGAGGALNALGAGLDATGIGAIAGVPLDLLGGALTLGGGLAESFHVGDHLGDGWFGGKKDGSVSKAASNVAAQSAALGKALHDAKPSAQTDQNIAMMAEFQKAMKGLMEQQTALSTQANDLLKRLVRSNKEIAQNT